jgi:hypothetical protein
MASERAAQRPSPVTMLRLLFAAAAVASVVLGCAGLSAYLRHRPDLGGAVADIVYYDLQLFVMDSVPLDRGGPYPLALEIARFMAPTVTVYALVDALYMVFSDRLRRFRISRLRGHHLVCGTGAAARGLADRLCAVGERVVTVGAEQDWGLGGRHFHLVGDPSQSSVLQQAGVRRARTLYAFTPDSAVNARITLTAQRLRRQQRDPLAAHMYVADPDLCQSLRARRLGLGQAPGFRLDFFNPAQLAARFLLEEDPLRSTDGHVLVVGLTEFGREVVVELARQRRILADPAVARPVMTLVDPDASRVAERLKGRYAFLREWKLIPLDRSPLDLDLRQMAVPDDTPALPDRTFLCDDDTDGMLRMALTAVRLWQQAAGRIVVAVDQSATYGHAFAAHPDGPLLDDLSGRLRIHGIFDAACDPVRIGDDLIEQLARAIHEHYVLDRMRAGETHWDNNSLVPWSRLPETLRDANRGQAMDIGNKLTTIDATLAPRVDADLEFSFDADEVDRLARMEHRRWTKERERNGWRFGPMRDDDRKLHPNMVDWQHLSEEAREKDRDAVRALPGILADAGFQIVRLTPTADAQTTES